MSAMLQDIRFGLRMLAKHRLATLVSIVALAVGIGFVLARALSSVLFGVEAADPFSFFALPLLLTAVAAPASYLPARRAARVDLLVALRYE